MKIIPIDYPDNYNQSYVLYFHPEYKDELAKIIEKSGDKLKFKGQYKQRLKYLIENKVNCILHHNWFEILKHQKSNYLLYSMKIKDTLNIRTLFILTNENAIFLLAFQERSDSQEIYKNYTPIAHQRVKELIENKYIKEGDILCQN